MRQELFLVRNQQADDALKKNQDTCSKPSMGSKIPAFPKPVSANKASAPSSTGSSSGSSTPFPESSKPPPRDIPPKKRASSKILFIGDSIISSADVQKLEEATQAQFTTVKAYTAVHDTVSNVAKQAARYPSANFTDIVHKQVEKDDFKCLVLQAGSVDISNLNTKDDPEQYMEYFRQEAVMSATNVFNAGINALKSQPTLRKVIIMKQIPRYDPSDVDPLSL